MYYLLYILPACATATGAAGGVRSLASPGKEPRLAGMEINHQGKKFVKTN